MITLATLKQDLEFSQSLGDIVDVLKTAALMQFRTFLIKEKPNPDFLRETEKAFELFISGKIRHPYFFARESLPSAIVVITSDEGFAGELNTMLINAAVDNRKSPDDELVVLGERGARYLEDIGQNFLGLPGISEEARFKEVEPLRNHLFRHYRRKFGRVIIVYPEFLSLTTQKIRAYQLLPYEQDDTSESVLVDRVSNLLIEPTQDRVLDALVWLWMGFRLSEIFYSAKQSEYAARIMHLEGSTQELSHLNQELSFSYFRQVHALSDKTIREITASKKLR